MQKRIKIGEIIKLSGGSIPHVMEPAQVNVIPSGSVKNGELFSFDFRIKNIGAGHYLPTWLTESRQMWLDITVTDGAGTGIYRSRPQNTSQR